MSINNETDLEKNIVAPGDEAVIETEQVDPDLADALAEAVDPSLLERWKDTYAYEQNMFYGFSAGIISSLVAAAIWAAITVITGYQIGWIAVGVGFLVGKSVAYFGKGLNKNYSLIGAGFAFLGCILGNLFSVCQFIAIDQSMSIFEVFNRLDTAIIVELMTESFSAMDLVFYGIAIYEGFKYAIRQPTEQELAKLDSKVVDAL